MKTVIKIAKLATILFACATLVACDDVRVYGSVGYSSYNGYGGSPYYGYGGSPYYGGGGYRTTVGVGGRIY